MGSYIKIDRKILEWEWYKNEHTKNVFLHCLLKAYWKDVKIEGKIIPRGSFVSSIGNIAEELALTPMEVRTALKHLKLTNEVTSKGNNRNTVFTVTNYDLYQSKEQAEQQTDNKQITTKEQTINKPLTTNEEYKEIKKDKKEQESVTVPQRILTGDRFNEFCELYPKRFSNILVVNGEYTYFLQTTPSLTEDDLIAAAKNYAEACRIQKTNERYIKNPENWLKDSTWISYLPENYKKPGGEKSKNKFNQFPQNDYDFEKLEKELLSN